MVDKRCFICGSPSHLKNQCPERNKTTTPRSNAKVNACQLQAPQSAGAALHTAVNENVTRSVDAEVQVCVGTETINDAVLDVKHEKTHCINATAIIF